jgi:hypothetical protein
LERLSVALGFSPASSFRQGKASTVPPLGRNPRAFSGWGERNPRKKKKPPLSVGAHFLSLLILSLFTILSSKTFSTFSTIFISFFSSR